MRYKANRCVSVWLAEGGSLEVVIHQCIKRQFFLLVWPATIVVANASVPIITVGRFLRDYCSWFKT